MIGKTVSTYRITAKLGEGGMGEVWRATDEKLGREVALKLLPAAVAADPDRMARFDREARVLASLNHPNVAGLHTLEEVDGRHLLVMELVEGDDLKARIAGGAITPGEALEIARQIADGLEAAHELGIVHRDLKPANVMLTTSGAVKVLDFGLAKAWQENVGGDSGSLSMSPTLTRHDTAAGVILGTAAYMAPEQARGRAVDRRADIWSFGVVLWEMLTGRQLFGGDTVSDVLAAVLKEEVDLDALPPGTPAGVRRLLAACLERDPRRRLQWIGDARLLLEDASSSDRGAAAPRKSAWWRIIPWLIAAAAGAVASWVWLSPQDRPSQPSTRRFAIEAEELVAAHFSAPTISPDGARIAWVANGNLYLRELASLDPRLILTSEQGVGALSWAPDSRQLAFDEEGDLYRIDVASGRKSLIVATDDSIISTLWTSDGRILFAKWRGDLFEVPARGGEPRLVLAHDPEQEVDFHELLELPDGSVVITVHPTRGNSRFDVLRGSGREALLESTDSFLHAPSYSPSGHLLFGKGDGNGVWAAELTREYQVAGEAFLVDAGGDFPSTAADGTLVYVMAGPEARRQLVVMDPATGASTPIGEPLTGLGQLSLSPDGTRVLAVASDGDRSDVVAIDLARGTRSIAVRSDMDERNPAWLPDGRRLVFSEATVLGGLYIAEIGSTTGPPPVRYGSGNHAHVSPDGRHVVYEADPGGTGELDLWTFELDVEQPADTTEPVGRPWVEELSRQRFPRFSGDGRWVAYESMETGRSEIYLRSFPGAEHVVQVTLNGGRFPRWGPADDQLYFGRDGELLRVPVDLLATPPGIGTPVAVAPANAGFDITPDGRILTTVEETSGPVPRTLVVVENWSAELADG